MLKYLKIGLLWGCFFIGSLGVTMAQMGGSTSSALSSAQKFALPEEAEEFNSLYPHQIKNLNENILSPEKFLSIKMGNSHLSYEQVSSYLCYLARVSNRVVLRIDGETYQGRPFVSAIISSANNLSGVALQKNGISNAFSGAAIVSEDVSIEDIPSNLLVNWLGYSVHGNEASGANASVVMAYLLAAGEDSYITDILEKSLVLLLPALNPDGVSGFASWANSNTSFAVNKDQFNREFRQKTPSSRSNHYWFDLNRDWLFAQHPELRAILRLYHKFKPHVVNDFHEHGNVSGTYFSPGVKSSTYPLIDSENWELTNKIAQFHSNYLDKIGTLYFSRERYDNFYIGKGAAYPSLAGAIGILYEQPNSKGLDNFKSGVEVRLVSNVRNQVYCSFSSLVGSLELKEDIFSYRERVARESKASLSKNIYQAYLFTAGNDISLRNEFFKILDAHNIKYFRLKQGAKVGGSLNGAKDVASECLAENAFAVPLDQEYPALIKAIFEPQLEFVDTTFYDITTWTVPMAFNINYSKSSVAQSDMEELPFDAHSSTASAIEVPEKSHYGYLFSMEDYFSYNFLYYLLDNGVFVRSSDRPFTFKKNSSEIIEFGTGSIVVPVVHQPFDSDRLYDIISAYFKKHSALRDSKRDFFERGFVAKGVLKVHTLSSGRGVEFDLGSRNFKRVTRPSIAIIIGSGTTYSRVGELWHLLDQRFRIPVTLLDHTLITASRLANYNVIVCTNNFNMDSKKQNIITNWAEISGNTFIALTDGVRFASKSGIAKVDLKPTSSLRGVVAPIEDGNSSVSGFSNDSYISKRSAGRYRNFNGVILKSLVDQSHPLSIGVSNEYVPVFKRASYVAHEIRNSFDIYSVIAPKPLLSGYLSSGTSGAIANTPYIIAKRGFVFIPDNPYFRGYWLGTSRAFLNALFFRELL